MSRVYRGLLLLAGCLLIPACGPSARKSTIATAPITLTATAASTGRIELTWLDQSVDEFEFRIERSDDNGLTFNQIGAAPKNSQAYSDLGLLPNKPYQYRITAWNSAGNSAFAGPASATTKALNWSFVPGGPGYRGDHSAIYDSLGKRMILFGGMDDFFTPYNDVWALDLQPDTPTLAGANHWTPLATSGTAPLERHSHSAIYDALNNRMIVFGGQDLLAQFSNDVYVLTLGASPTWSLASTTGTPPSPRIGQVSVYDPINQRMVVFGGNDIAGAGEKADSFFLSLPLNPPFVWTGAPAGPLKRTEHSAVYIEDQQRLIAFGGLDHLPTLDGSELNAETWSLSLTGAVLWNQLSFSSTPSFRQGHAAVYDAPNQRMVMFGGNATASSTPTSINELWTLRLDDVPTWLFLGPTSGTPPPVRYGHSAVYDSGRGRMVIFGGYDDNAWPNYLDTWVSDF